jgi:hypothetical protein
LTYHSHTWGVSPDKFLTDEGLFETFEVTSISYMPEPDGRPFASTIEGKKYPFFGSIFHPEIV